jgi:hypothetical protein
VSTPWPRPIPDPGKRWGKYHLFCTNPKCAHARRPHPIEGHYTYGGRLEPDEFGPTECPECDSSLDTMPLFESDEPYVSEEWE